MQGFNRVPNFEIAIHSGKLALLLIEKFSIPSSKKSFTAIIPLWVIDSDSGIQKAFIRGVLDGDGSIKKSGITLASGSPLFLIGFKDLLSSMGYYQHPRYFVILGQTVSPFPSPRRVISNL